VFHVIVNEHERVCVQLLDHRCLQVSPRPSPKPAIAAAGDRPPSSAASRLDDRKKADDEVCVCVFC